MQLSKSERRWVISLWFINIGLSRFSVVTDTCLEYCHLAHCCIALHTVQIGNADTYDPSKSHIHPSHIMYTVTPIMLSKMLRWNSRHAKGENVTSSAECFSSLFLDLSLDGSVCCPKLIWQIIIKPGPAGEFSGRSNSVFRVLLWSTEYNLVLLLLPTYRVRIETHILRIYELILRLHSPYRGLFSEYGVHLSMLWPSLDYVCEWSMYSGRISRITLCGNVCMIGLSDEAVRNSVKGCRNAYYFISSFPRFMVVFVPKFLTWV